MPTAEVLRLAEILDGAGFAYLEVSGGGGFDAAVRRGVESPWERIRALKARTTTPLGIALRGRFLVGSRRRAPGHRAPLRRLRGRERHLRLPHPRSAERRLEPPPLRRRGDARPAESSTPGSSTARAGRARPTRSSSRRASCGDLGAAWVISTTRPARSQPQRGAISSRASREASGLPVGLLLPGRRGHRARRLARRGRARAPSSSPAPSTRSR